MTADTLSTDVLIIGTGFSGIGLAIHLQKAGIDDFVLLEKAEEVGGTWRENTYPGAECDVASALYSFSFEHNAEWKYKWAEQPQILDYLKHCADKYQLYDQIRFKSEVQSALYQEEDADWLVTTTSGDIWRCRYLITAVGQLHHPFVPDIPGRESFNGIQFHSARWNHDADLNGKRVAVVGNAASALQFIPQIAPGVKSLTVFQRSANWVMPKFDRPYKPWEQWLSDKIPLVARLYRLRIWLRNEWLVYPVMRGNRFFQIVYKWINQRYLKKQIADPELRQKLTPDYPVGAKRVLFSDDYYEALARDNVSLVTGPIEAMNEAGILHSGGQQLDVEAVIYGTGFKTNPFLAPLDIRGVGDKTLRDNWQQGAHAYLGMATHGFPNFFIMYGPNTNLGHNSIIVMAESQARYIASCIKTMKAQGNRFIDVRNDAEAAFDKEMQERLKAMVWDEIPASWYKDGQRITNNWAGTTYEYMRRTRDINWSDYELV